MSWASEKARPTALDLAANLRHLILSQPTATSDRICERLLPAMLALEDRMREDDAR